MPDPIIGQVVPRKAADIPADAVLAAMRTATREREEIGGFVSRWDIACALAGRPDLIGCCADDFPDVPPKVLLAKLRKMIRAGLIEGCACGCRGDFEIIEQPV